MCTPTFAPSTPVQAPTRYAAPSACGKHALFATATCARRRRARLRMGLDGGGSGAGPDEMTCGDALREWMGARDRGEAPRDHASCAARRVDVLFVGRDNRAASVAAEAIFTDLCTRRALDCFSSHSAGTRVGRDGALPDSRFVEALRYRRGLDVSRRMACSLDKSDLESYSLIVCMDEHTRSEMLYMLADEEGRFSDNQEERIVVLSEYCSEPKLRAMQFRPGKYQRDGVNFVISALVDACNGLLASLIESPPIPQS